MPADPDSIESFDPHMLFYSSEEQRGTRRVPGRLEDDARSPRSRPLEGETPGAQIDAVVGRLARRGVSAYAVDVTSPDVAELELSVARVIAPELCALDVSHRARFLGGERLTTAAYEAGLLAAPLDVEDLNPHPHPFP